MRKTTLATILFAGAFAMLLPGPAAASVSVSVSVSSFHDRLSPYGRWVVSDRYGEVWIPAGIATDWEPYSEGEWVWTDYGWTWISDDPWGDVPCHYGSWAWDDPYGWTWVPGTVWSPAWVTWAWTDGYVGWAPVPPTFVFSSGGYSGSPIVLPSSRYVFVPVNSFVGVNAARARVSPSQRASLLQQAHKATAFSVSSGIVRTTTGLPRTFVERASRKPIAPVSIDRIKSRPTTLASAHVSGKRIGVAAPARERASAIARGNPRPSTVASAKTGGPVKTAASAKKYRAPSKTKATGSRAARTTSGPSRAVTTSRAGRDRTSKKTTGGTASASRSTPHRSLEKTATKQSASPTASRVSRKNERTHSGIARTATASSTHGSKQPREAHPSSTSRVDTSSHKTEAIGAEHGAPVREDHPVREEHHVAVNSSRSSGQARSVESRHVEARPAPASEQRTTARRGPPEVRSNPNPAPQARVQAPPKQPPRPEKENEP